VQNELEQLGENPWNSSELDKSGQSAEN